MIIAKGTLMFWPDNFSKQNAGALHGEGYNPLVGCEGWVTDCNETHVTIEFWEDDEYRKKQIGERLSDVILLDINGDSISLSSLNGKFRFISFIFTRCPIPNMCPAVVIKNGVLANNFRDYNNLELVMVSFDYIYDTPIVLKDFYGSLIDSYKNWSVWSSAGGGISDLYMLSSEIGCEFWGIEENNIGHNLRSALIGPNMELLKVWEGDQWLAKDVRKDIENYMEIVK